MNKDNNNNNNNENDPESGKRDDKDHPSDKSSHNSDNDDNDDDDLKEKDKDNEEEIVDAMHDNDIIDNDLIIEKDPSKLEALKMNLMRLDVDDGHAEIVGLTNDNRNIYLIKPLVSLPKPGDPRGNITNGIDWPFDQVCDILIKYILYIYSVHDYKITHLYINIYYIYILRMFTQVTQLYIYKYMLLYTDVYII